MKVGQHRQTNLPNPKDILRGIRELNRVFSYIIHDHDSVCSLIIYVARFHFVDKRSRKGDSERDYL